jgi:DNA-binding NarL/FixJ family response regulator
MTIRVLIADDQPLMRGALRACLESEPDIEVVGEAADGEQAVELVQRLRPEVVLLDIRMPRLDGIAATRRLASPLTDPPVRVVVITTFDLDEYIVEALRAGASGFLLKDASAGDVVQAVRVVGAGDALLHPTVTRRLLDRYARLLPPSSSAAELTTNLTSRERSVLQMVAGGATNSQIAQALHVAPSSVKTHVGHLLAKLGLPDRVHLVIFAYETGLIQPANRLDTEGR